MRDVHLFILLGLFYVAVIAVGSLLVMHADRRRHWLGKILTARMVVSGWLNSWLISTGNHGSKLALGLLAGALLLKSRALNYRQAILTTLAILALPALIVLLFGSSSDLEAYNDMPQTSNPVVAGLLRGEQLVPPPSLPPAIFVTKEIEAARYELASASREWTILDADFRQRLLIVYQLMAKQGYQMALLEGYRSPERQTWLAKLGTHITNASAYQSYHQYGLAADSAFYRDGKILISEHDPWALEGYRLYGQYAESVGLVWGGRWKMMDFGHVELRKPGLLAKR